MRKNILMTFIILLFASCNREDDPPVVITATRTVIVYMAADNDLSADAFSDIEEMKEGFEETGTNLVVFIDPAGESPYLLEIARNAETKVKTYQEFNSATESGTEVEQFNNRRLLKTHYSFLNYFHPVFLIFHSDHNLIYFNLIFPSFS
jgi:hypothetical protein